MNHFRVSCIGQLLADCEPVSIYDPGVSFKLARIQSILNLKRRTPEADAELRHHAGRLARIRRTEPHRFVGVLPAEVEDLMGAVP